MSDFGGQYGAGNTAPQPKKYPRLPHYYGDITRRLFLAGGVLMLIAFGFLRGEMPVSGEVTLLVVVFLSFCAGYISPRHPRASLVTSVLSACAVFVFGYVAFQSRIGGAFFWVNLVLAINFLFALYYSMKTWRWYRERTSMRRGSE